MSFQLKCDKLISAIEKADTTKTFGAVTEAVKEVLTEVGGLVADKPRRNAGGTWL